MILGYIFVLVLVVSTILVGIDKAIKGLMVECMHCGRDRFSRRYCRGCGVVGNSAPRPNKKNSRSTGVRFD